MYITDCAGEGAAGKIIYRSDVVMRKSVARR